METAFSELIVINFKPRKRERERDVFNNRAEWPNSYNFFGLPQKDKISGCAQCPFNSTPLII